MKRIFFFLLSGMLGAVLAATPSSGNLATDLSFTAPLPARVAAAAPSQDFKGRIAKSGGMYVLVDEMDNTTYQLDDQEKAKPYDGKSVKVTGSLDVATNTIHVEIIEQV